MSVLVSNLQEKVAVDDKTADFLAGAAGEALKSSGYSQEAEVSLVFVDDAYMQSLNQEYRNVDSPTDVLSFALQEGEPCPDGGEAVILGDVVVSLEAAERQAKEYGHSFIREAAFLTVHGVLHLLGHDHQDEEDSRAMRLKEEETLKRLGLGR